MISQTILMMIDGVKDYDRVCRLSLLGSQMLEKVVFLMLCVGGILELFGYCKGGTS